MGRIGWTDSVNWMPWLLNFCFVSIAIYHTYMYISYLYIFELWLAFVSVPTPSRLSPWIEVDDIVDDSLLMKEPWRQVPSAIMSAGNPGRYPINLTLKWLPLVRNKKQNLQDSEILANNTPCISNMYTQIYIMFIYIYIFFVDIQKNSTCILFFVSHFIWTPGAPSLLPKTDSNRAVKMVAEASPKQSLGIFGSLDRVIEKVPFLKWRYSYSWMVHHWKSYTKISMIKIGYPYEKGHPHCGCGKFMNIAHLHRWCSYE